MTLRLKKRGEKALERALVNASPENPAGAVDSLDGHPDGSETASEGDRQQPNHIPNLSPFHHRRETAECGQ